MPLNSSSYKASRAVQNGKINVFWFIAVYRQCSTAIGCRRLWLSRHASPTVSFVNSSVPSTQIIACKTAINKPSVWKLESNVDVGPALGSIDRTVHQVTEIGGRWWRRCRHKRIALQLIIVDNKQSVCRHFAPVIEDAVAKLLKAIISFMSVRLYTWNNSASTRRIFHEI